MSMLHAIVGSLASAVLSLASMAQGWTPLIPNPPSPAPAARNHGAVAYDAARGVTVLFGGYDGTMTPRGDLWAWSGTGWQQLGGALPPARWGHGMVYDTRRERLVLFGGFQPAAGNPDPDAIGLDDTWEYDGSVWTRIVTPTQPSPRGYFGMCYDPIRQRTLLFGGAGPNTTYLLDTWEWNGSLWIPVSTPGAPSLRRGPAMAYDLERAEVVLFGGGASGAQFGDTWVYDGTSWIQRNPAASPPARLGSAMAFDPLCGKVFLHGGATFGNQAIFGDSWAWDGTTWTQLLGWLPLARYGAGMTFDLRAGRSLMFGGRNAAGFRSDLSAVIGGCNRTMSTITPAVAGQTAQYRYRYPSTAVNNLYFELWTLRTPSAFAPQIPGIVNVGLARVDVANVLSSSLGQLGPSGTQDTLPLAIPGTSAVVGFQFDVQDLDIALASNFVYWAQNDVEATVAPGAPVASFTANPTSGVPPLVVQFTDTSLFATSWQWDFQNDGVIDSTQQNPTFTYTTGGDQSVRLIASGPAGSNTLTRNNLIAMPAPPTFTVAPSFGPAPLTVQFTDTTPFPVTSWQWDFQDDGVVDSTQQNPVFVYTANGTYDVRLVVGTATGPRTTVRTGSVFVGALNAALGMVPIPSGTFQMGSPLAGFTATPVRAATISRRFWMGRHEVTQAQYQALMGNNPSQYQGNWLGGPWVSCPQCPVEYVTWAQAVAYCDALTVVEAAAGRLPAGYEYRLPTEGEWEYCCRAGTTTEWHVGNSLGCSQANLGGTPPCNWYHPVPVGSYLANALGLHDMHGNVWELCLDGWDGWSNYSPGPITDPFVPSSSATLRILRGGSFLANANDCRSAQRSYSSPGDAYMHIGFRVVCAPILP